MPDIVYGDTANGCAYTRSGYAKFRKAAKEKAREELESRIRDVEGLVDFNNQVIHYNSSIKSIDLSISGDEKIERALRSYLCYGIGIPHDVYIDIKHGGKIRIKVPLNCADDLNLSLKKTIEHMRRESTTINLSTRYDLPKYKLID